MISLFVRVVIIISKSEYIWRAHLLQIDDLFNDIFDVTSLEIVEEKLI